MNTMGSDGSEGKYYPICNRCGEDLRSNQHAPAPGVCTDCYAIYDMDRFTRWQTRREEKWHTKPVRTAEKR